MSTLTSDPDPSDVLAVVEEVWTTFLGGEPLLPLVGDASETAHASRWDAAITVSGGWQGVILVSLGDELAGAVTDAMLGLEPSDERSTDDVVDTLGELVNVIGGNVKGLMPGPSKLSLPLVAPAPIRVGGMRETVRLDLGWGGYGVRVTVGSPASGEMLEVAS